MARIIITFDDGPRQRSMIADGNGGNGNGHTFQGQALTLGTVLVAFDRRWVVADISADDEHKQVVCTPVKRRRSD